jgi:aconitate hydratase
MTIEDIRGTIKQGQQIKISNKTSGQIYTVRHNMTPRQVEIILAGGLINFLRR